MRSFQYLPAALSLFSAGVWATPDPEKDVWVVVTKTNTVTVCPITHWDTCDNWPTFPPNPSTSQTPNGVTTTGTWSWTRTSSSSSTSTTTLSGPVVSTSTTSTISTSHYVGPIDGTTSSTSSISTGSTSTSSLTTGSTSSTSSGSTSSTSSGSTSSTSSGSTSTSSVTTGSTSSTSSGSTSSTTSLSTSTTSESTTSSTTTSSAAPVVTACTNGLQTGTSLCYNVQCGVFANGGAGSDQNKNTNSVGECVAYCVSINAPLGCAYSYGSCLVYGDAPVSTGDSGDSVNFAYIQPASCGDTTTTTTSGTASTSSTSSASTSTTSESTSITTTTSSDGVSTTTSSSASTTTTSGGGPGYHYPEGFFFLTLTTPSSRKMAKRSNFYFAFDSQGYSEIVDSQSDAAVFTISNGYLFDQDSESYVGIFGNQLGLHVAQADAVTVQVGNNGTVTIPGASNFCYVFTSLYFDITSYEGSTCQPLVLGVASDPNPPSTTTSSSTTTESTSASTSTSTVTVSIVSSTTTSAYGYVNGTTTTSDPSSTTTTSSYLGYNGTTTTTTSGLGYNATTTTAAFYNGTTTTSSYTTTTALNTTSTCNNATHLATSLPDVCNSPGSRSSWCDGQSVASDTLQPYLTGQTKYFTLTITNTTAGWDGLTTFDFAINGQNPGPLIELNWGDVAVVTVINQMQDNATTIHWHGVRQFGTNDQDGVPGVTECGIAPGSQRTYTWLASTYGTSWYHSHTLSQYGGGIRGPIIIHGPTTSDYDLDLGQIMIEDIYNGPFMSVAALAARTAGAPPIAINYLLNGKNLGPDGVSGSNPKWILKAGKKHLIRIINSSAQGSYIIHLDGHTFTVVSADFTPIVPYQTQNLYIQSGQRYMVVVEADQTPGAYFFRAITQAGCAVPNVNSGLGINNGIFEYETSCGVPPSNAFANGTLPFNLAECQDESPANLVPYVSESAGDASKFTASAETLPAGNADGAFYPGYGVIVRWYFGGPGINATQRLTANYSQPTLQTLSQVGAPYNSSIYSNAVVLDGPANDWVYFVIQNPFRTSHPIHLHGHDFSVLGQGKGFFDSSMVNQLNFANPIRRDTALLYGTLANPSGWTVIGFQTNNPGAWIMHCHIIWHADGGMALQYIEQPDSLNSEQYTSTSAFQDECSSLSSYQAQGSYRLPEFFESGIKKRHDFNAHAHIDSHIMHAAHRDVVRRF